MRRPTAVLLLSAAVPALIVVPTIGHDAADPHPVAPALTTVALAGVDAAAWSFESVHPAAAEAGARPAADDAPEVFTARTSTSGFSLVGVTWDGAQATPVNPENLVVTVRTRTGGSWQPWTVLATDSGDGPAEGEGVVPVEGAEGVGRPARAGTSPLFAGPSDGIQVRIDTKAGTLPAGLRVDLVDPGASEADTRLVATAPGAAQAAAGLPAVISRAQWGADESLRNSAPTYEPRIRVVFIHHTATSNTYTKDQAAAAVRSIYAYDTNSLGWSDIAYNVLVDKFGQIFEGRAGGLDQAVRSGATGGFNAESWAVSALGNYVDSEPSAALVSSISSIVAWKLGLAHRDPQGKQSLTAANGSGTTSKYADGTKVAFDVISGHRDAGLTACPGTKLYAKLPAIRSAAASRMGAQLYNPSASPLVVPKGQTNPVRIRALAMTAQSWRLEVTKQGSAAVVRSYEGTVATGGAVDQSWDLADASGKKVPAGIYTVSLQSWNGSSAAVPYAVNVALFSDPNVYARPADGIFHLEGRGYGHGHGMSQFGAEGAARQGLTQAQILDFYYPGTTVATVSPTANMRVALSAGVRVLANGQDIRLRSAPGLQVTEGSRTLVLPTTLNGKTVTAWRSYFSAGTLGLFGWDGSTYQAIPDWTGRPGPFRFTTAPAASTTSRVTLVRTTGQDVVYRGVLEARLNAADTKLNAVSEVLVDDYVKSVVSAEVPGGWTTAAYQAQAVAARTYGLFKRAAAIEAGSAWHICDTTSCQVYNGYSGETSPEAKAATATAGRYLAYGGKPIFAEFSSANGGWTADGGKPYLVAKADPYDGVVTGTANWGHAWTQDVSASSIQAAYPTLGSLQRIVVTARTDQGEWGGRVTAVRLEGSKADVTVSGTALRAALGLRSEWFRAQQVAPAPPRVVVPTGPPPAAVKAPSVARTVRVSSADRTAVLTWVAPKSSGTSAVTGYRVTVSPGGRVLNVGPTVRRVTVDRLVNGTAYSLGLVATSKSGSSASVSTPVTPSSTFGYQVSVPTTALLVATLPAATLRDISVLGTAGVPTTQVGSLTLRVTATSVGGHAARVKVRPTGTKQKPAQMSVPAGGTATNVMTVPPGTGGSVTVSTTKAATVRVEIVGYDTLRGKVGRRLIAVPSTPVGSASVVAASPLRILVAGHAGVPVGAPAALLQMTVSAGATATAVRVSPDGTTARAVSVVTVPAHNTRTVPVVAPLAADGSVRVLVTGRASVSADVQGYYVADDGVAGAGRSRSLVMTRIYDSRGPALAAATPSARSILTIPVLGRGGVPSTGVSAVLLNVIAMAPTASGSLTIYPAGTNRPAARSVTYAASTAVRTTVLAKVGAGGAVKVYLPVGGAHVLVDVEGYVTA